MATSGDFSSTSMTHSTTPRSGGGGEEERRLRVQITEDDLLCTNGCGFYGTPQCKGLCSQCWRKHQSEEKKRQDYAKNKSLLSFDKFEEKRKSAAESRSLTLKSLLRKSSTPTSFTSDDSSSTLPVSPGGTPSRQRHLSGDSRVARETFMRFLATNFNTHPVLAQDLLTRTDRVIEKLNILIHHSIPIEDLSEGVQNYYQTVSAKLSRNALVTSGQLAVSIEEVMQHVEQYLCVRAYNAIFCSRTDEEVADLSLQDRIRSLHWVTAGFLETTIDFSRQSVVDKMDEAVTELIDMNRPRGAADKLACLVRCSKCIFSALKESRSGAPASADEYLPVLIYSILKGNPPLIQSNLKFISRFALPSRIMSGESGYYFTNLSCALQFVQNMNAESLKMEREEFEAYTSGNQAPPLNEANCGCNQSVRSMESSLQQLRQLTQRQEQFHASIDEFAEKNTREHDEFIAEVREFSRSRRLNIPPNDEEITPETADSPNVSSTVTRRDDQVPVHDMSHVPSTKTTHTTIESAHEHDEPQIERGEEAIDGCDSASHNEIDAGVAVAEDLILFCEGDEKENTDTTATDSCKVDTPRDCEDAT